ncbi:MAG: hypothetical protein J3K34DRAFT_506468 [Monoraphidium minutum]|nr:MAG: hypothetical protein J3K34DRAFT_506468 [Monoraphidium minutum]
MHAFSLAMLADSYLDAAGESPGAAALVRRRSSRSNPKSPRMRAAAGGVPAPAHASLALSNLFEWTNLAVIALSDATLLEAIVIAARPPLLAVAIFWGAFAANYAARRLGAWLFTERIAEHLPSHRQRLMLSAALVGCATFLMGCLPSYETSGGASSLLFLSLFITQGIAMGGDAACSAVYLHRCGAPQHRPSLSDGGAPPASAKPVVAAAMALMATLYVPCLLWDCRNPLTPWSALSWRLPFYISAATAALAVVVRLLLDEPPESPPAKGALELDAWIQWQVDWGGIELLPAALAAMAAVVDVFRESPALAIAIGIPSLAFWTCLLGRAADLRAEGRRASSSDGARRVSSSCRRASAASAASAASPRRRRSSNSPRRRHSDELC